MLPSGCVNACGNSGYKSQSSSPFVCVPYRTVKVSPTKLSQVYLNAYSDVSDFRMYSGLSTVVAQLESTG